MALGLGRWMRGRWLRGELAHPLAVLRPVGVVADHLLILAALLSGGLLAGLERDGVGLGPVDARLRRLGTATSGRYRRRRLPAHSTFRRRRRFGGRRLCSRQ